MSLGKATIIFVSNSGLNITGLRSKFGDLLSLARAAYEVEQHEAPMAAGSAYEFLNQNFNLHKFQGLVSTSPGARISLTADPYSPTGKEQVHIRSADSKQLLFSQAQSLGQPEGSRFQRFLMKVDATSSIQSIFRLFEVDEPTPSVSYDLISSNGVTDWKNSVTNLEVDVLAAINSFDRDQYNIQFNARLGGIVDSFGSGDDRFVAMSIPNAKLYGGQSKINGGAGTDTAEYKAISTQFKVSAFQRDSGVQLKVTHLTEGWTDIFKNFENLEFADKTFSFSPLFSEADDKVDFAEISPGTAQLSAKVRVFKSLGGDDSIVAPSKSKLLEFSNTPNQFHLETGKGSDTVTVKAISKGIKDIKIYLDSDDEADSLYKDPTVNLSAFVDSSDTVFGLSRGDKLYLKAEGKLTEGVVPLVFPKGDKVTIKFRQDLGNGVVGELIGSITLEERDVDMRYFHFDKISGIGLDPSQEYLQISYETSINPQYTKALKALETFQSVYKDALFWKLFEATGGSIGGGIKKYVKHLGGSKDGVEELLDLFTHCYGTGIEALAKKWAGKEFVANEKKPEIISPSQFVEDDLVSAIQTFLGIAAGTLAVSGFSVPTGGLAAVFGAASVLQIVIGAALESDRLKKEGILEGNGKVFKFERGDADGTNAVLFDKEGIDRFKMKSLDLNLRLSDDLENSPAIKANGLDNFILLNDGKNEASGQNGDDHIRGLRGNDILKGGGGNDVLFGGIGKDDLIGGKGSDELFGGKGADRLNGGLGQDKMYAGKDAQSDIFLFWQSADSLPGAKKRDKVFLFESGVDKIDLSEIDAKTGVSGNQALVFSASGPKANSIWLTDIGVNLLVRGDINGNKLADFEIELVNTPSLSASDFTL